VLCSPTIASATSPDETTTLDCGTNALFVLLNLEGAPVSVDRLNTLLPERRPDGYSMTELQSAAISLGLPLQGIRFTKGDEPPGRPSIAFFKDARGGHFSVLRPVGATGTMVQVIDPPHAPRIIDYDRLIAAPNRTGRILVPPARWTLLRAAPWVFIAAGFVLIAAGMSRKRPRAAAPPPFQS
jgi:hypothetical protein